MGISENDMLELEFKHHTVLVSRETKIDKKKKKKATQFSSISFFRNMIIHLLALIANYCADYHQLEYDVERVSG